MDDRLLVTRSLAGELDAFNQLVTEYQDLAYTLAYRLLDDEEAAAGAVQAAFIRAFRSLDRFQGGSFRNWLLQIVVKICSEHPDEQRSRQDATVRSNRDPRPDGKSAHAQAQACLVTGIDTLPGDLRTVLVLRDVQGFACEEIAEIGDVPVDVVRARLSRARGLLRHHLLHQPDGGALPYS